MDEKTHAVVARLLDCIQRKSEREREIPVAIESPGRERSRDRERENRGIVATRDCTTNSYPEEHRIVKISSHFSPETVGEICEEKPERIEKELFEGEERTERFCCQG
jgi:hypothetical protein